jgi:DNA-binding response OmpR family regulator
MDTILLIEDTLEMQKLIQTNLSARDYEVIIAGNGEQGWMMANQVRPDLILLDVRLPGITGWQVLEKLKNDPVLRPIPVLIITASEVGNDSLRAVEMGAAGYISKPFNLHAFIARISQTLQDNKTDDR